LFVVATPIGNLEDFAPRAARVLNEVNLIAAEDTRHTGKLLAHFGIATPLVSLHEHNERARVPELIARLERGESMALVSDAGTPLVSDPGFRLVRAAHDANVPVVAVPGPCAAIAALSVSGLPSDRFGFEGFPPPKSVARRKYFESLRDESRTLIFYESSHRIVECVADMAAVFGDAREAVLARELTKQFETVRAARLGELRDWIAADGDQRLGEMVVLVHGAVPAETGELAPETARILNILARELPLKQAAALAAEITGEKKNRLYELALGAAVRSSRDD
jgi:16S rRNA (cytidine1402-2'-O)-methyltransferase